MRILMLSETCHIGGAEVMLRNLAHELRRTGHAVGFVGPSNGGPWLHKQLEADGFPVWTFELAGGINPGLLRTINRAVSEFGPDVLHSHLWVMAAYGGLVGMLRRVPHVTTMHGDGEQTRYARRRVALRWAFRHARSVVAVSEAMRDDMTTSLGVPRETMLVVPNGSPFPRGDRDRLRAELGLSGDVRVILSIGSQIPRKNHLAVLQALALLPASVNWRYVIAGPPGDATELVADFARTAGVIDRFVNLGPRQDVPDLLAACDLFVMLSLWEGMPVALVEAMGAGVPIISSAVGGIPAMLADGIEGVLLEPTIAADQLRDAVASLLHDGIRSTSLGEAARARATREYGVATMARAYEGLYGAPQHVESSPPVLASH
jgi:glycosyltransferase involved in cell wall biosynthesis